MAGLRRPGQLRVVIEVRTVVEAGQGRQRLPGLDARARQDAGHPEAESYMLFLHGHGAGGGHTHTHTHRHTAHRMDGGVQASQIIPRTSMNETAAKYL